MPQVLRVVCCFQCRQFQSDIVKKSNKWTCSRCNAKQTLRKEYGRGSGSECRLLAQQLSTKSCEAEDLLDRTLIERLLQDDDFEIPPDEGSERVAEQWSEGRSETTTSKWGSFMAKEEPEEVLGLVNPVPQSGTFHRPNLEPAKDDSRVSKTAREPSKSSPSWQSKRNDHLEPPTKTQSIPLMNFHQMGKQYKKQYKWESRKNLTNSAKISPKPPEDEKPQTQTFFSFKPKVPASLKRSPERFEEACAPKRGLDLENKPIGTNEVESNKMIRLDPISTSERNKGCEISHPMSSVGPGSKWNKFVVKHEEDDGIIKPC